MDPNRVLDIVLQVFESRTDLGEELYVPILTQYIPEYDSICQVCWINNMNVYSYFESYLDREILARKKFHALRFFL